MGRVGSSLRALTRATRNVQAACVTTRVCSLCCLALSWVEGSRLRLGTVTARTFERTQPAGKAVEHAGATQRNLCLSVLWFVQKLPVARSTAISAKYKCKHNFEQSPLRVEVVKWQRLETSSCCFPIRLARGPCWPNGPAAKEEACFFFFNAPLSSYHR